jgi:hypothetical protein
MFLSNSISSFCNVTNIWKKTFRVKYQKSYNYKIRVEIGYFYLEALNSHVSCFIVAIDQEVGPWRVKLRERDVYAAALFAHFHYASVENAWRDNQVSDIFTQCTLQLTRPLYANL